MTVYNLGKCRSLVALGVLGCCLDHCVARISLSHPSASLFWLLFSPTHSISSPFVNICLGYPKLTLPFCIQLLYDGEYGGSSSFIFTS